MRDGERIQQVKCLLAFGQPRFDRPLPPTLQILPEVIPEHIAKKNPQAQVDPPTQKIKKKRKNERGKVQIKIAK